MNDLSIVSHIKNDIEFLDQYWNHIHSYDPREIIILDTGSLDGTWERLQEYNRNPKIFYTIEQYSHYTGQVHVFNKVINMATSTWVMKIDTDELYKYETVCKILDTIEEDKFNCINIPTIHHFINSDLYFNCLQTHPDYHQRIFKKEVFERNAEVGSRNHGSIMWAKPLNILTLDTDNAMYHYSFLRSLEKLNKRAIINYYIDVEKSTDEALFKYIEAEPNDIIDKFRMVNPLITPAFQLEPTLVRFNSLEDFYIAMFTKYGTRVTFEKPEDLKVEKISSWPKAEEALKNIL